MIDALWITLIGMGLVFAAILLLWGLMALLVRVAAEPAEAQEEQAPSGEPPTGEAPSGTSPVGEAERSTAVPGEMARKRRAAAAAVAVTLALRRYRRADGAAQPAGSVSAWQAVHRAGRIGQGATISRKKVER